MCNFTTPNISPLHLSSNLVVYRDLVPLTASDVTSLHCGAVEVWELRCGAVEEAGPSTMVTSVAMVTNTQLLYITHVINDNHYHV